MEDNLGTTDIFTPEQTKQIKVIVRDEIENSLQVKEFKAAADKFASNADIMQRIFADDQMLRARAEREMKDQMSSLKSEMENNRQQTTNAIERIEIRMSEESDEHGRWRESIESVGNELRELKTDFTDFKYRVGDALVVVTGRNPMIPDSTPVMPSLRARVETAEENNKKTENHLGEIKGEFSEIKDFFKELQARDKARQEWLNKVFPQALQPFANNPLTMRIILLIVGLLLSVFGFNEASQLVSGGQ